MILDQGWFGAKTANYYNVPPGNYIFRVKAANSDGFGQRKILILSLYLPGGEPGGPIVMYGVLFIAGVFATHRFQKESIVLAERERTNKKNLHRQKKLKKHIRN